MQITFNVPEETQREAKELADHIGVNVETLINVLSCIGFQHELRFLRAYEMPFPQKSKDRAEMPAPIDWHKRDKPAPIDWPKRGRDEFD